MAVETTQLPIETLSYLVLIHFYNIFIAHTLYPKLSVQLFAYRRFFVRHAIQIIRASAERSRRISRPGSARNGSRRLPGAVSRKSDNFASQLRYRAVRGTRGERGELIRNVKGAGGQVGIWKLHRAVREEASVHTVDSPGVIEPCTQRGHYLMEGFASSCLAHCYKYFSESTRRPDSSSLGRAWHCTRFSARGLSGRGARKRQIMYSHLHIWYVATTSWKKRSGTELRYGPGRAFRFRLRCLSPPPSFPLPLPFRASFCNCGIPLLVHDINFAFYYIALY